MTFDLSNGVNFLYNYFVELHLLRIAQLQIRQTSNGIVQAPFGPISRSSDFLLVEGGMKSTEDMELFSKIIGTQLF